MAYQGMALVLPSEAGMHSAYIPTCGWMILSGQDEKRAVVNQCTYNATVHFDAVGTSRYAFSVHCYVWMMFLLGQDENSTVLNQPRILQVNGNSVQIG